MQYDNGLSSGAHRLCNRYLEGNVCYIYSNLNKCECFDVCFCVCVGEWGGSINTIWMDIQLQCSITSVSPHFPSDLAEGHDRGVATRHEAGAWVVPLPEEKWMVILLPTAIERARTKVTLLMMC